MPSKLFEMWHCAIFIAKCKIVNLYVHTNLTKPINYKLHQQPPASHSLIWDFATLILPQRLSEARSFTLGWTNMLVPILRCFNHLYFPTMRNNRRRTDVVDNSRMWSPLHCVTQCLSVWIYPLDLLLLLHSPVFFSIQFLVFFSLSSFHYFFSLVYLFYLRRNLLNVAISWDIWKKHKGK